MGAFLLSLFAASVGLVLRALGLMWGVALVHAVWAPSLPTVGFWQAAAISACISLMMSPRAGTTT